MNQKPVHITCKTGIPRDLGMTKATGWYVVNPHESTDSHISSVPAQHLSWQLGPKLLRFEVVVLVVQLPGPTIFMGASHQDESSHLPIRFLG